MTQAPEQPTDETDQAADGPSGASGAVEAHSGQHAVAVARAYGVEAMFTLSGAHVFPMYDGAVTADPPMRIIDVRHEQTAAFAAEAMGKLTRTPGLAVLTAGPGVTNGVSAIAQAQFNGSPLVVVGGRAPANRWGMGSLQELDQPPILAPVTKLARTIHTAGEVAEGMHEAFAIAGSSHRGPVFVDIPMDEFFNSISSTRPDVGERHRTEPDGDAIADIAELLGAAERPVLIMGTDVWADGAEEAALRLVEETGVPVITNGMGRGIIPGGHPLLVTKARGVALGGADLVVVAGTPLDFRLGYGIFGGKDGATAARVVHLADSPGQVSPHADLAAEASGDLTLVLDGLRDAVAGLVRRPDWSSWVSKLQDTVKEAEPATPSCSAPRPTRSTRPASTASWCHGWRTMPSSSVTAATSCPSPASSSSPSAPAAGSTPAPTVAWAPVSARRSRRGSPARRPRSSCCTATARPACP